MNTDTPTPDQTPKLIPKTTNIAWFTGPAFLIIAAWFVLLAPSPAIPVASTPEFSPTLLEMTIRGTVKEDPPILRVGSYEYRCNDCHDIFKSGTEKTENLYQHLDIKFNHGINNRCFNCHDQENRNKLVGRNGGYISYTEIPTLCSQCHGPTFRDWERGMHGKTLGSWETDNPNQRRLECSECHNPHSPAFPDYEPLPGPNTLRMGDQPTELHHERKGPLALPFRSENGSHTDEGGADQ